MRKMRERTKIIMLVTAAAFVLLMVVEDFDFGAVVGGGMAGGELGRVNGESIGHDEFSRAYQELYQQRQQRSPDPISTAESRELEDAAWEQIIMDRLIEQEIKRRGIEVTTAEIRRAARSMPPAEFMDNEMFHTDGQFDMNRWHQFLASPALDTQLLIELEQYYRRMLPRARLFGQIASGIHVSDSELWRQWKDRNEQIRVRFVAMNPGVVIPDEAVSISDREIRDFYNRNRDDFRRPAEAEVRILTLSQAPTAADSTAARERALELRQRIQDGESFGDIARAESADPGSAREGGMLGTFQRGQMVPAFEQAVWSQGIAEVGEPVLTRFGYHLIEVESRNGDHATARHILIPIELGPETENELLAKADEAEALARTRTLEEIGHELDLTVRTIRVNQTLPFVPGVGQIDEGVAWIFEDDAEIGEISPLLETPELYYMLELVDRQSERRLTFEEAEPTIRSQLLRQRKIDKARDLGREVLDRVRAGADLVEAAAAHDLGVEETNPFARVDFVPGIGQANAAIGAAFGLTQPGQVSGLIEADGRLYVMQLLERTEADREEWEAQKETQRYVTISMMEQQRVNRFLESLRENARITDNRDRVLQRRI